MQPKTNRNNKYSEEPDINTLLSVSDSYMLKCLEALEIIEDVYAAIKGWCQTTTELQIPIKLLESYYIRWS